MYQIDACYKKQNTCIKQTKHTLESQPAGGCRPVGCLQCMVELITESPKTNPANGREEDLNPGPPDYQYRALSDRPHCLHLISWSH